MTSTAVKRMSVVEKISTMEEIWDDLCQRGKIDSPDWHGDILRAREAKNEIPVDWEVAKKQLLARMK